MNNPDGPEKSCKKYHNGWYLALRPVDGAGLGVLIDVKQRSLYAVELFPDPVAPDQVLERLLPALKHLAAGRRRSPRTQKIPFQVEPQWLLEALQPELERLGFAPAFASDSAMVDSLLGAAIKPQSAESRHQPPAPLPGYFTPSTARDDASAPSGGSTPGQTLPALLTIPAITPDRVAALFSAAADFYRAAPWERLSADAAIGVHFTAEDAYRWALLIGAGGDPLTPPGLLISESLADLQPFLTLIPAPDALPQGEIHVLTFEANTALPPSDMEAIREFGWETAADSAFPLLLTLKRWGVERPNREEVARFEAVLRALPDFVIEQIEVDESGASLPVEAEYEVQTAAGVVRITLVFPVQAETRPLFPAGGNLRLTAAQKQAARLAHSAWQEPDPERQLSLARAALAQWPEAADALLVLAEAADDPAESVHLLERAAAAADRLLTPQAIETAGGDLWEVEAARPFLRARLALAEALETSGRPEDALRHYQALLQTGPSDPAGARYPALALLMRLGRDEEARRLLRHYHQDPRPEWRYSEALLAFRSQGDTPLARRLLADAVRANGRAPAYLTGARLFPSNPETGLQSYEDEEAVEFALRSYPVWWSTPGAITWLNLHTGGGAVIEQP